MHEVLSNRISCIERLQKPAPQPCHKRHPQRTSSRDRPDRGRRKLRSRLGKSTCGRYQIQCIPYVANRFTIMRGTKMRNTVPTLCTMRLPYNKSIRNNHQRCHGADQPGRRTVLLWCSYRSLLAASIWERCAYRRPNRDIGLKRLRKTSNPFFERLRLARTLVTTPAARGIPRYYEDRPCRSNEKFRVGHTHNPNTFCDVIVHERNLVGCSTK